MAKKLTLDDINKAIKNADYWVYQDRITVCVLTLQHDYMVVGYSACMDAADFDPAIGRSLAQQNAVSKIWELEAYLTMYKNAKGEDPVFAVSAILDPVVILTPEDPVSPPAEPPAPPPPPVETAEPGSPMPTPSDLPITVPEPEAPPSDPLPEDQPSPAEPPSSPPEEPAPESPPAPPVEPAPEPVPEPAPDVPMAMTVNKPIAELTPEELVVEEAALAEREKAEITREEEENTREAAWRATHPDSEGGAA